MNICRVVALGASLLFCGASVASAADPVKPRRALSLSGAIQFPRPQAMTIRTGRRDSSRLTVTMGFNGRCKGGGLGELFASTVNTRSIVRVAQGRFAATLTGAIKLTEGRTAHFRWRLTGRFVKRDVAVAKVDGDADVRVERRVISRCSIGDPARVRLAVRRSA